MIYLGLVAVALMLGNVFIVGGNILATPFLIAALAWAPRTTTPRARSLTIRFSLGIAAVLLGIVGMLLSVLLTESTQSVAVVAGGPLLWLASLVQLALYVAAVVVTLLLSRPSSAA